MQKNSFNIVDITQRKCNSELLKVGSSVKNHSRQEPKRIWMSTHRTQEGLRCHLTGMGVLTSQRANWLREHQENIQASFWDHCLL